MSFELRDHTADVAVHATAPTLSAAFAATADGLAAACCDEVPEPGVVPEEVSVGITVTAENREALLFDYLDELIYRRDVQDALPVDNEVTRLEEDGDEWVLTGLYRAVALEAIDAREVKAVTYSQLTIEETDEGWTVYVVLDV